MSYKKAYQNAQSLVNMIQEDVANINTDIKSKGLVRKNKSVGDVLGASEQGQLMALIRKRPDLKTMYAINQSFKNKKPVEVASLKTTTDYNMRTHDKLPDGTLRELTKEEKAQRAYELDGNVVTKSVTENKEYTTDISKKLIKDLKAAFPDLTRKQLSAILGNLHHESKGFTRYQQIMGEGVSYAQWSGSRKDEFLKFSKDNNLDPKGYDAPLKFLIYELNNNRKHGFLNENFSKAFNNPDATLSELTEIFENNYLAAGKKLMSDRIVDAEAYNADDYPFEMTDEN
tara:strand:+ start:1095 stop:1952 length:858 start_codon:yes stop_codon:yes gene_type:complete